MNEFVELDYLLDVFLEESTSKFSYCNGVLAYEWAINKEPKLISAKKEGDYEQNICNFLTTPNFDKSAGRNNVLVIVGGSGTGKSTTLRNCLLKSSETQKGCDTTKTSDISNLKKQNDILIDFRYLDEFDKDKTSLDSFWRYITEKVRKSLSSKGISEQLFFWKWCLSQDDLLWHSEKFQNYLIDNEEPVQNYLDGKSYLIYSELTLLDYLDKKKQELFKSFSAKDMAWYNLLLLVYDVKNIKESTDNNQYKEPHLFIDNIDHLSPALQTEAVDLAILLASTLELKTIINIRPLTWVQAVQGQYLVEQKDHYAPDPLSVVISRLEKIEKCLCKNDLTKKYFHQITTLISGDSGDSKIFESKKNILKSIISATSGISIRYALRNTHNMLKSNIIRNKYLLKNEKLSVSDIAKSFFFGEKQFLLSHAFENIYSVHNKVNDNYYLIKPRILDFILRIRNGISKIREVFSFCRKFGYDDTDTKDALEELMLRSRALVWSSEGWTVKSLDSFAEIMITPIGRNYYDILFGELFYIEICLAENTEVNIPVQLVVAFDRRFGEIDYKETSFFIKEHGASQYSKFYNLGYGEITPLSLKHYYKLKSGIEKIRKQYEGNIEFDEKRDIYIKKKIEELLN